MKKSRFKTFCLMGVCTVLLLALPPQSRAQDSANDPTLGALIAEHSQSPCLKDRSPQCLTAAAAELRAADLKKTGKFLLEKNKYDEASRDDLLIYKAILLAGDKEAAQKILPYIQDAAERIALLYIAENQKAAEEEVAKLTGKEKAIAVHLTIMALTVRNDLDAAFDMAKQTFDPAFDPPVESGMAMSLWDIGPGFASPIDHYPIALSFLSTALVQEGRISEAEEINKNATSKLKEYAKFFYDRDPKSRHYRYNQETKPRETLNLEHVYLTNLYNLAQHYIKEKQTDKARDLFAKALGERPQTNIFILDLARMLQEFGLMEELSKIDLSKETSPPKHRTTQVIYHYATDYTASKLARYGFCKEALAHIAQITIPNYKADALLDTSACAKKINDMETLRLAVEQLPAAAYNRQYPAALDRDFSKLAVFYPLLGKTHKAEEAIKIAHAAAKEHLKDNSEEYKRDGLYSYIRNTMDYHIIRKDIDGLFAFAQAEDINSARTALIMLLTSYAENKDWTAFDALLAEKKHFILESNKAMWHDLPHAQKLVNALYGQEDRLEVFIQLSYEGDPEKERWDFRKHRNLLIRAFQENGAFDQEKLKVAWIDNLRPDKNSDAATTPEYKVYKRYMPLIQSALYKETKDRIKTFEPPMH